MGRSASLAAIVVIGLAVACGSSDDGGGGAGPGGLPPGADGGGVPPGTPPPGSDGGVPPGTPPKTPTLLFGKSAPMGGAIASLPSGGWVVLAGYVQTTTVAGTQLVAAGRDVAVIALSAAGDPVWATRIGGAKDEWRDSIAVDASGAIYVSGVSSGTTVDFGNGVTVTAPVAGGAYFGFYAKLDGTGKAQWARTVGADLGIGGCGLALRGTQLAVSGIYSEPHFHYETSSGTQIGPAGNFATYVVSASTTDGYASWVRLLGTGGGGDVAIDSAGDVVVTSTMGTSVSDDVGPLTTATGSVNGLVLAYGAGGAKKWARPIGNDIPYVATDGAGHLALSGVFSGTTDFGTGPHKAGSVHDPWLAGLDPATGTTVWDKVLSTDADESTGRAAFDGNGNVAQAVVHDGPSGPVTIDGIALPTSTGMYIAKMDGGTGTLKWLREFTAGSKTGPGGGEIAANAAGDVAMTGSYGGAAWDLGAGPLNPPDATGNAYYFLGVGDPK